MMVPMRKKKLTKQLSNLCPSLVPLVAVVVLAGSTSASQTVSATP
jgi:uncharacterized lipoprotein YajG